MENIVSLIGHAKGHYRKTSRAGRPTISGVTSWRLKDTVILVERRKIALVSVSSQCWLCSPMGGEHQLL